MADVTVNISSEDTISVNLSGSEILSNHIVDTSNPHEVTATQVGLGNVDNTADVDKPISTATQTVLDGKISSDTTGITGADQVTNLVSLAQAEYDAITPDVSTVYMIVG